MRRIFRLLGLIRLATGTAIVLAAFLFRENLGEVWTGILILLGAAIGVSGFASVLLMIAYNVVLPFIYIGILWLVTDIWDGSYYSDTLRRSYGYLYFYWGVGLIALPVAFYYMNQSWFFMVKNFAVDELPTDTPHPELFATGILDLTGSPYLGAATITEQGLILDRRNFSPVILPWRWVTSIEPDKDANPRFPSARVAMRNDDDQYLTLTIPWNEALLDLNTTRLKSGDAKDQQIYGTQV